MNQLIGKKYEFKGPCRLSCRIAGFGPPLLLVHGVGNTSSMAEMLPLFEALQGQRTVVALDLPGFGSSERSDRDYTPRLMADALHMTASFVRVKCKLPARHRLDAVAYGLSCEFLARAAAEDPARWGRLSFISPTGLNGPKPRPKGIGRRLRSAIVNRVLKTRLWGKTLFEGLTSPLVVRREMQSTFGTTYVDDDLFDNALATTRDPGARFAPLKALTGQMSSKDIIRVYAALQQPVWVTHGKRGIAAGFQHNPMLQSKPNWRLTAFKSGAMPHFQHNPAFVRVLTQFLAEDL
jgi:pimeloyl-ACP methyl ester carboxylesterase